MALVERVTNILLKPRFEWPKIAEESATTSSLFTGYIMLLAAIGPLAMAVKTGLGIAYTAAWIAAVLQLIPLLGGVLSLLGAIYAWYTFYLGVAVMKKCPEEKAVVYTVAIVVCGLLLGIVLFGALMSMFFGGAMMGGAALLN